MMMMQLLSTNQRRRLVRLFALITTLLILTKISITDARTPERNLALLAGTWSQCEVEWAYFAANIGVETWSGTGTSQCDASGTLVVTALNDENTAFQTELTYFDGNACDALGLDEDTCPNYADVPGAALIRFHCVGTYGPSKKLQETIVFISDYVEYLDRAGTNWETVTDSAIRAVVRVTCDLKDKKANKRLFCTVEIDTTRAGFDVATTASLFYVKDLTDKCKYCD